MAPCGKTKCDCGCKKKTTKPKRKGAPRPRRNIPQAQPNIIMMPQPSGVISAVSQISGSQVPKTKTTETQTEPKPKMVSSALQTEPKPKMVSMGLQTESKPKMVSTALQTEMPKMLTATVEQQQKEVVKPTKYQRKPITVSEIQKKEVVEPLGRYGSKVKELVEMKSTPAPSLSAIGGIKPIKERKSIMKLPEVERAPFLEGVIQQPTRTTIPQRKAIEPSSNVLQPPNDKFFREITTRQRIPQPSITNVAPRLNKGEGQFMFRKSPTTQLKKQPEEPNRIDFDPRGGKREGAGRPKKKPTVL